MSGGPLSYEPFFGLKRKPFSLASDPEFLYESPSHAAALEALLAGIRRREGLLALTGDVGMGKTTICRAVLRNLDRTTFSAFIPDPFASREDLLKMLLVEFGVTTIQDLTTGPLARAGRTELSYLLTSFLDTLVPLDAFVVVFIDEAQNMSLSLLEEVRILSDAYNRHGQLQLVFVGQLELLEKLKSPAMRQVDQRVSVYTRLSPLGHEDVIGYIHHRLQIAGASPNRPMFAPNALALIHEASGGVPRLINRLCDRALDAAHQRRSPLIDRSIVAAVLDDVPQPATRTLPTAVEPASGESSNPGGETAPFARRVDAWLSQIDSAPPSSDAPPVPEAPAESEPEPERAVELSAPLLAAPLSDGRRYEREPERYMQKLGRKWARTAVIAGLAFAALNAIAAAASYVPSRLNEPLNVAELPPVPMPPPLRTEPLTRLPVAGAAAQAALTGRVEDPSSVVASESFGVAVGAFTSVARAEVLLAELLDAGYRAFRRRAMSGDRVLQQVFVGPYRSHADAEQGLELLRAGGRYADARVMEIRTVPGISPPPESERP
jgi:type II secretory pathway predicted ATPase ExeA/cell division protein FtsN